MRKKIPNLGVLELYYHQEAIILLAFEIITIVNERGKGDLEKINPKDFRNNTDTRSSEMKKVWDKMIQLKRGQ